MLIAGTIPLEVVLIFLVAVVAPPAVVALWLGSMLSRGSGERLVGLILAGVGVLAPVAVAIALSAHSPPHQGSQPPGGDPGFFVRIIIPLLISGAALAVGAGLGTAVGVYGWRALCRAWAFCRRRLTC